MQGELAFEVVYFRGLTALGVTFRVHPLYAYNRFLRRHRTNSMLLEAHEVLYGPPQASHRCGIEQPCVAHLDSSNQF